MKAPTEPVMPSEITGSGKPVVLVPGGLTGWLSWKPHAERLASSPGYFREIIDILGQEFPRARVEELPRAHALPIVSIDRYLELFVQFVRVGDRQ